MVACEIIGALVVDLVIVWCFIYLYSFMLHLFYICK